MDLDRLFLVSCLCISVALVFYFFHWNRFLGSLIGCAIRVLYWAQEGSSIWVSIGSIHFSLVAGRILLRDVCYHSSNQTIKIVKAQVQWRYWIRRPMTEQELNVNPGGGEEQVVIRSLHCRIHVSLQGFEWFLYNRTASFDNIISQMEANSTSRPVSRSTERRNYRRTASHPDQPDLNPPLRNSLFRLTLHFRKVAAWVKSQLPTLDPMDLLPIGLEITKGVITCGNSSTSNLLVAEFKRTHGHFGIVESRSKFDVYKQLLSLGFEDAVVRYVENEDYTDPMISLGELVHGRIIQTVALNNTFRQESPLSYRLFSRLWDRLSLLAIVKQYVLVRREHHAMQRQQAGSDSRRKRKSMNEPLATDFSSLEYAIQRKILEAPVLELTYYYDIVGDVPAESEQVGCDRAEHSDIGNGDLSPEWGIDLVVHGGFFRYGPWADRQRVELQRAFFPPSYSNAQATPTLKPGDKRTWLAMQVLIELRGSTTMQLPFREPSKDWQWDGKSNFQQLQTLQVREAAAIYVMAGDRSTIKYTLPMVIGLNGYTPILDVHLDSVTVTSTLNDIRLVTADSCDVHCELPSPLCWNEQRIWSFSAIFNRAHLYLIRDHIHMLTDLGKDWVTGPPTDYHKFIPMVYAVSINFNHYEVNLYGNDQNIIDKPLSREENVLLTAHGMNFKIKAEILSNKYRPDLSTVPFSVEAPDIGFNLSLPRWNTNALHAPKDGSNLVQLRFLHVEGSFRYFTDVREDNIDQLNLRFTVNDGAFKALGWSIRYLMVLRDNYFGSFTHFSILYEYLEKRNRRLPLGDPIAAKYRPGKNNMMQVTLKVFARNVSIILPAGLPGFESHNSDDDQAGIGACLILQVPTVQLHLRLHDHYMEMSLNFGSLTGGLTTDYPERVNAQPLHGDMEDILVIEGLDITANRLFGPQPKTATYVCIWEIRLGHIKSLLNFSQAKLIAMAGNAFRLNFTDLANAPAKQYMLPLDPDVTFIKTTIDSADLTWLADRAALTLSLPRGVKFSSNDLGGRYHKKIVTLRVPQISVKVLLTAGLELTHWWEAAEVTTSLDLDMYSAPRGYKQMNQEQMIYMEEQDELTGRARRMLSPLEYMGTYSSEAHSNGLHLPQPKLPIALNITGSRPQNIKTELPLKHQSWPGAQLSDSDVEEGVSEADRDARLAKTRTSTPVTHLGHEDNENMSGGDESDDEDLTDGSSDDDWSELANTPEVQADSPMLMHYSQVTRRYTAQRLTSPVMWDTSPFVLVRDHAFQGWSPTLPAYPSIPFALNDARERLNIGSDRDVTYLCLQYGSGVDIRITPLILTAVAHFEVDLQRNPVGPELCIDSLLATHLGSFSTAPGSESRMILDVLAPWITIQILQRIITAEGHPVFSPKSPEATDLASLGAMVIAQVRLHELSASGIIAKDCLDIRGGIHFLSCMLDISLDQRTIHPTGSHDSVFSCTTEDLMTHATQGSSDISWKSTILRMGHLGPGYILATCIALTNHAKLLRDAIERAKEASARHNQDIVSKIIRFSGEQATFDPLSTIQPSFLIQSDAPHALRTDLVFRFLSQLRDSLWHLRLIKRDTWEPNKNVESMKLSDAEKFSSILETRLSALDPDTDVVGHLASLAQYFPILRPDDTSSLQPSKAPSMSINIRLFNTVVVIVDPSSTSPSQLVIVDLYAKAQFRHAEVVQPLPPGLAAMSQASLKEKYFHDIKKTVISISLGGVTLAVFPHLMNFTQRVLQVRRSYLALSSTARSPSQSSPLGAVTDTTLSSESFDFIVSLQQLRIQAAAENLVFEFGVSHICITSLLLFPKRGCKRLNSAILCQEIYLRARSPTNLAKQNDQDILAFIELREARMNFISGGDVPANTDHRLIFTTEVRIHVPRSALRLYRFIEEWRADYLPGIEATVQALLSELNQVTPKARIRERPLSLRGPSVRVQGKLPLIRISLQVMHGTWLSWEASSTIGSLSSMKTSHRTMEIIHSLHLGSMVFSISSQPDAVDAEPKTRLRLVLPAVSATGRYNGSVISTNVLLEFVEFKVKPSHWDTLLIVQQKFGQDFNDLVNLVQQTQQRRSSLVTSKHINAKVDTIFRGSFKIRGFRIGLEGLSSTVYLECLDIRGGIDNQGGLVWNVALSDLAFSLAARSAVSQHSIGFKRNHRSAFVIIDLEASAKEQRAEARAVTAVRILGTKIHAVMQPSSIGEVGDFIDHLQSEMLIRKDQRALELAAFKEKTRSILKTLEVGTRETRPVQRPVLQDYAIDIWIRNVGFAFPLTHNLDLELPRSGTRDSSAIPAFLLSVGSVTFETHRGETGQAKVKHLALQFIPRFRQSVPGDFSGENHQTRNRLLYPEMKAQLRSANAHSSRQIWMGANVSGFILDLDSNIPSYVFSLIDVYQQGKDRMDKLTATIPRSAPSILGRRDKESDSYSHSKPITASIVSGSLIFLSGKVRVYSGSASSLFRTRYNNHRQELSDDQIMELGAEVFNLPVVSVWAEYRAAPTSQKLAKELDTEPPILMFKSTVHSSQNTLRPTLLPFLTELVNHVDTRLRKISINDTSRDAANWSSEPSMVHPEQEILDSAVSSMRISFSLRIDQSRLELTCQPDVNVVAGLHWDNGGFVVNIAPGARKITFTGSVGGLSLGLKHGFLSEDCAKLDARNLAFSIRFAKADSKPHLTANSISVVLDTEFLGIVRFSRLQDILCFKAVWLDRIPVVNSQSAIISKTSLKESANANLPPQPRKEELSTAVLVRIRQIALEVDLGQSISSVTLNLQNALLRTNLTKHRSEVSVFVADLGINARGNIIGHARVPNCIFETVRDKEGSLRVDDWTVLRLHMTSGPLVISLESDHQKLLHYRAEPLKVWVFDDWSAMVLPPADGEERPIQLSFNVVSSEIVAVATVGTIPKLLAYVNKFRSNLDAQRQGASRESKAFRITHTPKPDNPLSAVAEAMLSSARTRFKEVEHKLSYIVVQHMSLRLQFLQLIVFPRTMEDFEIAQLVSKEVKARLTRFVESGKRDLDLSFSSMTISRFTGLGHSQNLDFADGLTWPAQLLANSSEATIVGLPSMAMHMSSEEATDENATMISYDFNSTFDHQNTNREQDIFITLNVGLYSWLTLLRKNLTREMEQVRATADLRIFVNASGSSNVGAGRKKLPDPSNIPESQFPSPLPSPATELTSPFSPSTALGSAGLPVTFSTATQATPPQGTQAFPLLEVPEPRIPKRLPTVYKPRTRQIERLRMRQLGEATPDVMHPFFMKKAGFNLEDSLPQYVHEYATTPLEQIMESLLELYSRQLKK